MATAPMSKAMSNTISTSQASDGYGLGWSWGRACYPKATPIPTVVPLVPLMHLLHFLHRVLRLLVPQQQQEQHAEEEEEEVSRC